MARLIKLRRGTKTQHETFTGEEGEVTVVTDDGSLRVHDGVTVGGNPIPRSLKNVDTDSNNITVEPNTLYNISGTVSSLTLSFPKSTLESSVYFTCGSDSFSLTLNCTDGDTNAKIINKEISDLSFENGKTYILSILNGYVIVGTAYPIQ